VASLLTTPRATLHSDPEKASLAGDRAFGLRLVASAGFIFRRLTLHTKTVWRLNETNRQHYDTFRGEKSVFFLAILAILATIYAFFLWMG
jgi:hypothetical protein